MIATATRTTTWTIDSGHSAVEFAIRHLKITTVRGRFSDFTGQIEIDRENIQDSRVNIEIDAASIDTRNGARDADLRSANFFEVQTFPTIRFTSTRVQRHGDDLIVTGDLEMHGVTQQVLLVAIYNGQAETATAQQVISYSATTTINRRDFGLNWNQALETGGVLVGEEVRISIEIEAYAND